MAKKKLTVVVSPEAVAAYAWLARPDEGQQYSDGKYKVTLVLDKKDKEVEKFIETLEQKTQDLLAEEYGKIPKNYRTPFKDGDDSNKEDFAGKYLITIKSKYQPGFVDRNNKQLDDDVFPLSGDIIRGSFALMAYTAGGMAGVSGQMRNIMLIEKNNNGGAASDFGEFADESASGEDEDLNDDDFDL
jgi:hypothetical protein